MSQINQSSSPFPYRVPLPNGLNTDPALHAGASITGSRLNHLCLRVRDSQKSLEFYINLMGCELFSPRMRVLSQHISSAIRKQSIIEKIWWYLIGKTLSRTRLFCWSCSRYMGPRQNLMTIISLVTIRQSWVSTIWDSASLICLEDCSD
jgi:hypothetical protein